MGDDRDFIIMEQYLKTLDSKFKSKGKINLGEGAVRSPARIRVCAISIVITNKTCFLVCSLVYLGSESLKLM